MTNPSPRPALRKAPDADVHPAAPEAAFVPATIDLRENLGPSIGIVEPDHVTIERPELFSSNDEFGTTSHKVKDKSTASAHKAGAKLKSKKADKADAKRTKQADAKRTKQKAKKAKNKSGKKSDRTAKDSKKRKSDKKDRIDLRAGVPLSVRRELRHAAKARGTSAEAAVESVLSGLKKG